MRLVFEDNQYEMWECVKCKFWVSIKKRGWGVDLYKVEYGNPRGDKNEKSI